MPKPTTSQPIWRRSARSTAQGNECVEVAGAGGTVAIRDSKDPAGPRLALTRDEFRCLLARVSRIT